MIRRWEKTDNKRIAEMERECFLDPWDLNMLDGCFKADNFFGLVEESNGEIIGYCGSVFDLWEAEILLVAVSPDHRRRGIARNLLSAVIDKYKKAGKEAVFLEVRRSNIAAQALYYELGFKQVGEREKYYQNTEDALVLKKSL